MKKILALAGIAFFVLSCSNEDMDTSATNDRSIKKLAREVYPEFDRVMTHLYNSEYDIAEGRTYQDLDKEFYVSEVYLGVEGDKGLAGYFVTDSNRRTVYLDYQEANDIVDQYEYNADNTLSIIRFDLTLDPNYTRNPFNPSSPVATNGKFFGWGDYERGPCEEINGEWSRSVYQNYYAFGVAVSTRTTYELDGVTPLREPCGPSVHVD